MVARFKVLRIPPQHVVHVVAHLGGVEHPLVREDSLRQDDDVIRTYIKSELAGKFWGKNQEYQIRTAIDNQVQDARRYFDEATEIARNAGYF